MVYDLIILGGGSAGLSAGIYAGRAKLRTLILEKANPGGQASNTEEVVNYPGIRHTSGPELMKQMQLHAMDFGVQFQTAQIERVDFSGEIKKLYTKEGVFSCRSVILATGANPRKAGFVGEQEFTGRGVAYCATCDGEFFTGLDVFVIGGGYAAAEEAIYLTRFAKTVTVLVREEQFSCARTIAEKTLQHPQIRVRFQMEVQEVQGDTLLRRAIFLNRETGETETYEAQGPDGTFGIFVFVGYEPATEVFRDQVEIDSYGYIPTNENMETNVPGVFAAGDLRPKSLRQIVTAVSDGAIAATAAERYVTLEKERLGLPMFEEMEETPVQPEQTPPTQSANEGSTAQPGAFLNDAIRQQLKDVFARLTRRAILVTVVEPQNAKCLELQAFLQEISSLSDKIQCRVYQKGENRELEEQLSIQRYPVAVLLDEKERDTGVKFSGVPGGHEINSLVLAIYHLAGSDGLSEEVRQRIAALQRPVAMQICVSLSCHLCPDVVTAAQSIALANPNITAEMLDLSLFSDLRQQHQIMSVPAILFNGQKLVFGSKTIDEILDLLETL